MRNVKLVPELFSEMCAEKNLSRYALSRIVDTTPYQILRISKGENTSFRFLVRLVPIFGIEAVASIIADHRHSEAFALYAQTHR